MEVQSRAASMKMYATFFLAGMKLGLRNFGPEGIRAAGLKRAIGFILQPVENWSRHPELACVRSQLPVFSSGDIVLDLGSPKMFGLVLAQTTPARLELTDLWPVAVDEVRPIAQRLASEKARITLGIADATRLDAHGDASVDHAFSISVIEHIPASAEGGLGAAAVFPEVARVLKPGGHFVFSIPVSRHPRDEFKDGDVYGKSTEERNATFFQHIFGIDEVRRLLDANRSVFSIERVDVVHWSLGNPVLKAWRRVPQKLRGLFGFINLALAPFVTRVRTRVALPTLALEGDGDLIVSLRRLPVSGLRES